MKNNAIRKSFIIVFIMVFLGFMSFAASTITVNTSSGMGSLMYGGIGFLYGLALNTPSDAMITGLVHLQYTGQNAPDGAQHPDGYADKVLSQAQRTGFKGVYVCCQDIYAGWPYPNNGLNDYLSKLTTIANTFKGNSMIIYNIFNEPNINWYATSGTGLTNMCNDWKTCYDKIKSIDPSAKTMGPGFSYYAGSALKTFFDFCKNNNCMPDFATWHELGDDFYTSWYSHYNDFRNNINNSIPIMINEYARSSGDLGNPGNLIQHLAKYENSNVYGCLAYWTGHGTLNDLVANNNTNQQAVGSSYNQPTGAWYLYQWYGQMTGNQVSVTLPSQEGSLQAIAGKDGDNVTILFGGGLSTYDVNVVVQGLSGSSVNYTILETINTGRNTASAPSTKASATLTVSGGSVTIPVTGCAASSAFKITIIPGSYATPAPTQISETPVPTNPPSDTAAPSETPAPTAVTTTAPTNPPGTTPDPTNPPASTDPPSTGCTCINFCSSQTAISVPFTKDGAGEFCYTSSALGAYVNSWNTDAVNINGTNCTNMYVSSSSIAAIGGVYYVYYKGSYSWSHFEVK